MWTDLFFYIFSVLAYHIGAADGGAAPVTQASFRDGVTGLAKIFQDFRP